MTYENWINAVATAGMRIANYDANSAAAALIHAELIKLTDEYPDYRIRFRKENREKIAS